MPHKATYLDKLESQPENDHDRLYHTVTGMCNRLLAAQIKCGKFCGDCEPKCQALADFINFKPEGEQK